MHERLKESLRTAPVVDFGGYQYFVHPVTDGVPELNKELLEEIIDGVIGIADLDCDKILTPEAMGIPIASALTLRTGIPFCIIRKKKYKLPGEVEVLQKTGYSKGALYINGLRKGDRVVIVDDVLSTGGTMRAIVTTLRKMGVVINDIVVVVEKGGVKPALERELGLKIKSLVKVDVRDGKVIIDG